MSKARARVSDYAGNELGKGDLISYAARLGNTVRMRDAVVEKVTTKLVDGRLRPMLRVRPTGVESGFLYARTVSARWVEAKHVRLIPGEYT